MVALVQCLPVRMDAGLAYKDYMVTPLAWGRVGCQDFKWRQHVWIGIQKLQSSSGIQCCFSDPTYSTCLEDDNRKDNAC